MPAQTPRRWTILIAGALACGVSVVGCSKLPERASRIVEQARQEWNAFKTVITGGRNPLHKSKPAPSPGVGDDSSSNSSGPITAAHAQIMQELIRVLLLADLKDPREFRGYVRILDQGASIEGVYNGLTHSDRYRQLEESTGGAKPAALEAFVRELELLESALPLRTDFSVASARPLPRPVTPGLDPDPPKTLDFGSPIDRKQPFPAQYRQIFKKAGLFTLKRVISSEAIRVISAKKQDRKALAAWYSKWAVELAGRKVDFGLPQRNRADEKFQSDWASQASEDLITWEVLNRLNRILNEASK